MSDSFGGWLVAAAIAVFIAWSESASPVSASSSAIPLISSSVSWLPSRAKSGT